MGTLIEMSSVLRHMAALAGNQDLDMKRITTTGFITTAGSSISFSLFRSTFVRNARSKKLVKTIPARTSSRRNDPRDPFRSVSNGFLRI